MKLTFKQFFPIPMGIAILAFFLMLVDLGFAKACEGTKNYFVVWIAFQAWAMYFMAGCKYKDGVKVFLGYLGGRGCFDRHHGTGRSDDGSRRHGGPGRGADRRRPGHLL